MHFEHQREALIGLLVTELEFKKDSKSKDTAIENLIGLLRSIKLNPDLPHGIAETVAKANMMVLLSNTIQPLYHKLTAKSQLQLQIIFNDGLGSEIKERGGWDKCWEQYAKDKNNLNYKNISSHTENLSLIIQNLSVLKKKPISGLRIIEKSGDNKLFKEMKTDVDQDKSVTKILKPGESIGTTGLATCVAAILYGKNSQGQTVVNLAHHAIFGEEDIQSQKDKLRQKGVVGPITEIMIGASLQSFKCALEVRDARGERIQYFDLAVANLAFQESTSVALQLESDGSLSLYYGLSADHPTWNRILKDVYAEKNKTEYKLAGAKPKKEILASEDDKSVKYSGKKRSLDECYGDSQNNNPTMFKRPRLSTTQDETLPSQSNFEIAVNKKQNGFQS